MDAERFASTADRLIAANGAPFLLQTRRNSEYDPATSLAESEPRKLTGRAVETIYRASDINGDTIRVGDQRLLVGPRTVDGGLMQRPMAGDRYQYDGMWWSVVSSERIRAATTDCAYWVQGRR